MKKYLIILLLFSIEILAQGYGYYGENRVFNNFFYRYTPVTGSATVLEDNVILNGLRLRTKVIKSDTVARHTPTLYLNLSDGTESDSFATSMDLVPNLKEATGYIYYASLIEKKKNNSEVYKKGADSTFITPEIGGLYTPSGSVIVTYSGVRVYAGIISWDYISNFSVDNNGWAGFNSTLVNNQDGITDGTLTKNDVLKFYANGTLNSHYIYLDIGSQVGYTYEMAFDYYIPSGQTNVVKVAFSGCCTGSVPTEGTLIASTVGQWTTHKIKITLTDAVYATTTLKIVLRTVSTSTFAGANNSNNDRVFIKNIRYRRII